MPLRSRLKFSLFVDQPVEFVRTLLIQFRQRTARNKRAHNEHRGGELSLLNEHEHARHASAPPHLYLCITPGVLGRRACRRARCAMFSFAAPNAAGPRLLSRRCPGACLSSRAGPDSCNWLNGALTTDAAMLASPPAGQLPSDAEDVLCRNAQVARARRRWR